MAEEEKKPNYSKEYIYALPLIKREIMGRPMLLRYDDKAKIAFLMNSDGRYAGKYSHIDLSSAKGTEENETESQNTQSDEADAVFEQEEIDPCDHKEDPCSEGEDETEEAEAAEKEPKGKGFSRRTKVIIAVLAAVVVLVVGLQILSIKRKINAKADSTVPSTTAEAEPTTEPEETKMEEETITVLAAKGDILPGHVLTEEDIEQMPVAELQYRNLSAAGGLYTDAELQRLIGMVSQEYIPEGTYLRYNMIGTAYSPVNPWGRTDTQPVLFTLPVTVTPDTMEVYLFGNQVDISLTIETKVTTTGTTGSPDGNEESGPPVGIEHNSSTIESTMVDTYLIKNAAIVDILDADGNSLYARYQVLSKVPAVFRAEALSSKYGNIEMLQKDLPSYVVIAISAEQAAVLNALDVSTATVAADNAMANAKTELQSESYQQIRAVASQMAALWNSFIEEA